MNVSTIISVNPAKATLGSLYSIARRACARTSDVQSRKSKAISAVSVLNFIFPTRNAGLKMSGLMLAVRSVFSALLIFQGIWSLAGGGAAPLLPEVEIALGALLFLGILARFVSLAGIVLFCIELTQMPITDSIAQVEVLAVLIAAFAIICFAGPGWFSIDGLVNKWLHSMRGHGKKRNALGWNSFRDYSRLLDDESALFEAVRR